MSSAWQYPERGELPADNRYVLCELNRDNCLDPDDQAGSQYVVAKFIRAEQTGNNQRPYQWKQFGPSKHFGQDVVRWQELPRGD